MPRAAAPRSRNTVTGCPTPQSEAFAHKVRDVSEVLVDSDLPLRELPVTVAYHDACHLAHGQRIRTQPRELLRRIPGLTLRRPQGRRSLLRQRGGV